MASRDDTATRDLWYLGSLLHLRAMGEETGGAYALVEEHLPEGFVTPEHVHRREDEAFLLLDGEMTFWIQDGRRDVRAGDYILLPRNVPHSFAVTSPTAHVFNIVSPAGFEHFFIDMGEPAGELVLPPTAENAPLDLELMARILADYGVDLLGPPPAPGG